MDQQQKNTASGLASVSRRQFVKSMAGAGAAGLALVRPTWAKAAAETPEQINVAFIGTGVQGGILMNHTLKIPGVRVKAIADIYEFNRVRFSNLAKRSGHEATPYIDYKEMLETEKDLDAVVIATPDFVHAEMTNHCLKAGLHVYCEKEMSNTIEEARTMVQTQRETGKLLQIGHQRRSNPYYHHAYRLIHERGFFGDITHVSGQWNQAKRVDLGWPDRYTLDEALLNKYGYGSMAEFRNWRWFRQYAGGPMADLGSHQVDIFNWFLKANPKNVYATGSNARAIIKAREEEASFVPECEDNVLTVWEWDTPAGVVRGFYQVVLTSTHRGFFESFMGTQGSFDISEISNRSAMFREPGTAKQDWEDQAATIERDGVEALVFDPGRSGEEAQEVDEGLEADLEKPPHMVHLENFFGAIRGKAELTCDAEHGYETAVTVLRVNDALKNGGIYNFSPDEFKA